MAKIDPMVEAEEKRLSAMGRAALDNGLVKIVATSDRGGSITKPGVRLLVVPAGVPDDQLFEDTSVRGAILLPDGNLGGWNLLLAFPKFGDWYDPYQGKGAETPPPPPAAKEKKRWGKLHA